MTKYIYLNFLCFIFLLSLPYAKPLPNKNEVLGGGVAVAAAISAGSQAFLAMRCLKLNNSIKKSLKQKLGTDSAQDVIIERTINALKASSSFILNCSTSGVFGTLLSSSLAERAGRLAKPVAIFGPATTAAIASVYLKSVNKKISQLSTSINQLTTNSDCRVLLEQALRCLKLSRHLAYIAIPSWGAATVAAGVLA